jgi:hypothetical protein
MLDIELRLTPALRASRDVTPEGWSKIRPSATPASVLELIVAVPPKPGGTIEVIVNIADGGPAREGEPSTLPLAATIVFVPVVVTE